MKKPSAKRQGVADARTPSPLVPAKAGTQRKKPLGKEGLDSRLRGNERRERLRGNERRESVRGNQRRKGGARNAKRRPKLTPQQWQARHDAQRKQMRRKQCNLFQFWRECAHKACARARSCVGDPEQCFMFWWPLLPEIMKEEYRALILTAAGRMPPNAATGSEPGRR